ncbi:hypothetical protein V2S66_24430 [Streptomyces sp. V4-01]|uniref:Uncharacterized protein n=1 Tax=Actinacidiphila polyblastidii TaxID=3110430 RepID=A0ABU7PH08_9ACTN|nr:hypothetical protein [Streptomyces sp. V4-01]
MFEFLKLMTETTTQALSGVAAHRRDKRRRDLAVDLFLIYVRLNEAMVNAEDILALLAAYVRRGGRHREEATRKLHMRLTQQGRTLRLVSRAMAARSAQLIIIEAAEYDLLSRMVWGKLSDVDALAGDLARHRVRLGDFPSAPTRRARLLGRGRTDVVFDPEDATKAVVAQVRRYLRSGAPQRRVAEIRSSLERLRALLAENFSLEDVLIDVGARKSL